MPHQTNSGALPLPTPSSGLSGHLLPEGEGTQLRTCVQACTHWLQHDYHLAPAAATQLAHYLGAAKAALGLLPTREKIVFERFFDEVGDTHLVIHAPLGSRVMRAWGLALRKRFCRQFNFELQAAALDDSLVLSLGPTHSFPLEDVGRFLHSDTAADVLVQAVLQAPMFPTRWRWAASVALAVARNRNGKRQPPQFQRSDAEDLLTHAFPDAVACAENLPGEREIPEHPLVQQALQDCLHEVMDADGMLALLRRIESGEIEIVCRDLTAPSPLSESILNARPYAFLDDGAAEERRTQAVRKRGLYEPETAADLGRLDPAALARVREEMQPDPVNADELHDALVVHGFLTETEARPWASMMQVLVATRRATRVLPETPLPQAGEGGAKRRVRAQAQLAAAGEGALWVAAERLRELRAVLPDASTENEVPMLGSKTEPEHALREVLRSRLELLGPTTEAELNAPLGIDPSAISAALLALEQQGYVMRGDFTSSGALEWCERRRLARIHRYTRDQRRAEFEPVSPAAFMRFLCDWQGLSDAGQRDGPVALETVLAQLEGFPVAAVAWESEILPARMQHYDPAWLDQLCNSGRILWQRPQTEVSAKAAPVRGTPILLLPRASAGHWNANEVSAGDDSPLNSATATVLASLRQHGASFFVELVDDCGLLRSQVETALGELVSNGLVTADGFAGLRALIAPANIKARRLRRGGLQAAFESLESAGRWSLLRRPTLTTDESQPTAQAESIARVLLRRYGVLFRKLIEREPRLPPWRELHYVLRRLEARGEIRGGRFVSGFSGEQFALAEAATSLRRHRQPNDTTLVVVPACDPLNLTGVLLPGERVPAVPGNRVLLRDGVPVASIVGREPQLLATAEPAEINDWRTRLLRWPSPPERRLANGAGKKNRG